MPIFKWKLPNGNTFIWFGRGIGWKESKDNIDNALILAGGDLLFLKTAEYLSLIDKEVERDIKNLSYEEFIKKYNLKTLKHELWMEIKNGLETGEYPAFLREIKNEIDDYEQMIYQYLNYLDEERLKKLKKACDKRIIELKRKKL